jgi:hypothetical protein
MADHLKGIIKSEADGSHRSPAKNASIKRQRQKTPSKEYKLG